jgi:hypothetical protein
MANEGRKETPEVPDFTDEKFWQEFNQQLWALVKKAEPANVSESLLSEPFEESADVSDVVSPENSRKKECLSFARYNELAENPSALTAAEKTHLEGCRHCERHIAAFAQLMPREVPAGATTQGVTAKASWRERVVEALRAAGAIINPGAWLHMSRAGAALAALIIILAAGGALLLIRSGLLRHHEIAAVPAKDVANQNQSVPSPEAPTPPNTNAPKNSSTVTGDDDSASHPKPGAGRPNKRTTAPPKSEGGNLPKEERAGNTPAGPDLRGRPTDRAVLASLKAGRILLDGSDYELLREKVTRGLSNYQVAPIYPKNEATFEANPNFRWQGADDLEYRVIVSYRNGSEVDSSKVLAQPNGRLEIELAPGIYYWRIAVRRQGEKEEIVPGYIIFKVLSQAERQQLESAVSSAKSNLVRAILYARAGFPGKAEAELEAELNENPGSTAAKKMLAQVQGWRRK